MQLPPHLSEDIHTSIYYLKYPFYLLHHLLPLISFSFLFIFGSVHYVGEVPQMSGDFWLPIYILKEIKFWLKVYVNIQGLLTGDLHSRIVRWPGSFFIERRPPPTKFLPLGTENLQTNSWRLLLGRGGHTKLLELLEQGRGRGWAGLRAWNLSDTRAFCSAWGLQGKCVTS